MKICKNGYSGDGIENCEECGIIARGNPNARIVGGNDSTPYAWPYVAYITNNRLRCKIYIA